MAKKLGPCAACNKSLESANHIFIYGQIEDRRFCGKDCKDAWSQEVENDRWARPHFFDEQYKKVKSNG